MNLSEYPRCTCRHYRENHIGGECQIAGCECILFEPRAGTVQALSEASGNALRERSEEDKPSAPSETVEQARQALERAIVCLLQVSRNYADEFGRRTELAEGELTLAIDHLIAVVRAQDVQEKQVQEQKELLGGVSPTEGDNHPCLVPADTASHAEGE